jgi:hypothetical protein
MAQTADVGNNDDMQLRPTHVALITLFCAQATVSANTSYNLTFGSYSNQSLQYTGNNYVSGDWTEMNGGTYGSGQQIVCMVSNATTTNTCGNPGPGSSQHIPIYTPPSNYAIWGGTSTSTYFEVDGDPAYGAPIYTDLDAANGDALVVGDSYTLSFYQASNEETNSTPTAYNDYWQVYMSAGTGAGTYICPVCSPTVGSGTLVFTSPGMQNPGGASTPWIQVTFTFTATSTNEILEFVPDAVIASGPEPSPTGFNPPFLDLAAITLTQNAIPEPGTWALTILGIGGACIASRLRGRRSSSTAAMNRLRQS